MFDYAAHLRRQRDWSERTFGPGERVAGVTAHIEKECAEVRAEDDRHKRLEEWIDIQTLALDGAWRDGFSPEEIIAMIQYKQFKNEHRKWPDWRTVAKGQPIEHIED